MTDRTSVVSVACRSARLLNLLVGSTLAACAASSSGLPQTASQERGGLDTQEIEAITGLKGTFNAQERVFKVTSPRTDVPVTVDGRRLEPFLGLTSWAAFTPGTRSDCMVMSDLVLFQDDIDAVMSAALDHGLAVTALHNHFSGDEPKVYFMHIGGEGTTADLARGVRAALDAMKSPATGRRTAVDVPGASAIPAATVDQILGTQGQVKDGMYKAVFGREVERGCGCKAGKEMGVNTWAGFAGTADVALVDGDFVVFEDELQSVLKVLRRAGISVAAIHNHMEGESPRATFLHY
jgi:hypothetical protein